MKIKEGDIVVRYSYNQDIVFYVYEIIKLANKQKIAILKGINIRVEADAPVEDLKKWDFKRTHDFIRNLENNFYSQINVRSKNLNRSGKILHLDGDRRYGEKTLKYYRKMNLNAVVINILESKQPQMIIPLLNKYQPDILVITGHDSMLKKGRDFFNLYNYRNSKYFIDAVINARKWENSSERLAIFAGAWQSFYEAIIEAGADFASSPGRILIDFIDPIIVANKIATTEKNVYITGKEMAKLIKEGAKGVDGIGAKGKQNVCRNTM